MYCITDVEDLHQWHVSKCDAHPLFRKLSEEELKGDVCVEAMIHETEEGKKVARAGAAKYYAVYQRIEDPIEEKPQQQELQQSFFDSDLFGVLPA